MGVVKRKPLPEKAPGALQEVYDRRAHFIYWYAKRPDPVKRETAYGVYYDVNNRDIYYQFMAEVDNPQRDHLKCDRLAKQVIAHHEKEYASVPSFERLCNDVLDKTADFGWMRL